ncbi:MAG: ParB/RepB/Spo0J family partition protein [Lachnospiraceae bacterium]|nr:ParB/RepB/Spo0J family partition protein [Lachnospiraceae bacterium]
MGLNKGTDGKGSPKKPGGRGLGKGIDALIPNVVGKDSAEENTKAAREQSDKGSADGRTIVNINKVEPNRKQPRKKFDEDALQELADSIKIHGLIEPIVVQDRGDHYEIVAGERRWRACKIAGLKEVPVSIGHYTEKEILEISIIENTQREDLNPIEEAMGYKRLVDEFNYTQDDIAERISKSRSAITNSIRLLKLSDKVQEMLVEDLISAGHGRALLAIEDKSLQEEVAQRIVDEKLNVRDVEKLVNAMKKPVKPRPVTDEALKVFYHDMEEGLKMAVGTKVSITGKGNGAGCVTIEFYNNEDLDRIAAKLRS